MPDGCMGESGRLEGVHTKAGGQGVMSVTI